MATGCQPAAGAAAGGKHRRFQLYLPGAAQGSASGPVPGSGDHHRPALDPDSGESHSQPERRPVAEVAAHHTGQDPAGPGPQRQPAAGKIRGQQHPQPARQQQRHQRRRHGQPETLNTTALVHEAYEKLSRRDDGWADRRHFFRVAARAMRDVLPLNFLSRY